MQVRVLAGLRECGYEATLASEFPSNPEQLQEHFERDVDALVVHRSVRRRCRYYDRVIRAARTANRPVLCDVDDLLIEVPDSHPDYRVYHERVLYALRAIVDADLVITSTRALQDQLSAFHRHVLTVPNRLPEQLWKDVLDRAGTRPAPGDGEGRLTLGYIGSDTHYPDLLAIEEALVEVLQRHRPRVEFLSVGVPLPPKLRALPMARAIQPCKRVAHDYTAFPEFAVNLPIDIGIAPLIDHEFNRCKSDLKFQEYAALGIPAVYADVEPYRERVKSRVNGLLAGSTRQWCERIEELIESPAVREEIRSTAAEEVVRLWASPPRITWDALIAKATSLARDSEDLPHRKLASVVGQALSHQRDLEFRLRRTVEFQVARTLSKLAGKVMGLLS